MAKADNAHKGDLDAETGFHTTGHEWDGIRELNRPLPRWWLWTFYATIVWAVGYMIAYPSIPLIRGNTEGVLGVSSRQDVANDIAAAKAAQAGRLEQIATLPLEDIRADADLSRFAISGGRSAFLVNCVQCHGSGAAGSPGYANLNDDDWIWGGTLESIYHTIAYGIRSDHPDTHISEMPAFGADGLLTRTEIASVADYVLSMGGQEHNADSALAGQQVYADNCASCHGDSGEGSRDLGAPRLSDAISLYSGARDGIIAQITQPRHGVMPAWIGRLDDTTIKQLALYVHALGGGETETASAE
jgi:cytochrome c oxidase cbb3-type subunit 3